MGCIGGVVTRPNDNSGEWNTPTWWSTFGTVVIDPLTRQLRLPIERVYPHTAEG